MEARKMTVPSLPALGQAVHHMLVDAIKLKVTIADGRQPTAIKVPRPAYEALYSYVEEEYGLEMYKQIKGSGKYLGMTLFPNDNWQHGGGLQFCDDNSMICV